MTIEQALELVASDTKLYRRGDEYHLPPGRVRSIAEMCYLAGQAEGKQVAVAEITTGRRGFAACT